MVPESFPPFLIGVRWTGWIKLEFLSYLLVPVVLSPKSRYTRIDLIKRQELSGIN